MNWSPPCATISCDVLPLRCRDVWLFQSVFERVLPAQKWAAYSSCPGCELAKQQLFWDSIIWHACHMTSPPELHLANDHLNIGHASSIKNVTIGDYVGIWNAWELVIGTVSIPYSIAGWTIILCLLSCRIGRLTSSSSYSIHTVSSCLLLYSYPHPSAGCFPDIWIRLPVAACQIASRSIQAVM